MAAEKETIKTLENILRLAATERASRTSGLWKTDIERAIEEHGEDCERIFLALYEALDNRDRSGDPVPRAKRPIDQQKQFRQHIVAALKKELPSMVANIIDEME